MKIRLVIEIKNVVSQKNTLKIVTLHYIVILKIGLQIGNCKFHCFQNRNLSYTFQMLFAQKRGYGHPYFLYENQSLQHYLSYDMRQMETFLGLEVWYFERICFKGFRFFSGPGSGSRFGFQTVPKKNVACMHCTLNMKSSLYGYLQMDNATLQLLSFYFFRIFLSNVRLKDFKF